MDKKTTNLAGNPFFLMVAMGIGVAVIIAIAIAATRPHVGEAVGSASMAEHGLDDHSAEAAVEEAPAAN